MNKSRRRMLHVGLISVGLIIALVVLLISQFSPDSNRRLVEGSDYPWIVFLQSSEEKGENFWWGFNGQCSGALIAPRWVLTAAHCLHGKSIRVTTARLATKESIQEKLDITSLTSGEKERELPANPLDSREQTFSSRLVPHPGSRGIDWGEGGWGEWDSVRHPDLALVQLKKPISGEYVQLPEQKEQNGSNYLFYGFGSPTRETGPGEVTHLYQVPVEAGSCLGKKWEKTKSPGAFCSAEGNPVDVCMGDSGGPVVAGEALGQISIQGVLSLKASQDGEEGNCSQMGFGGLLFNQARFISVYDHLEWIRRTIKNSRPDKAQAGK